MTNNVKRPSTPEEIASHLGLKVEARKTSTSGRWVSLFCEHTVGGLPCFDILHVRVDGLLDRHHYAVVQSEGSSYEECRTVAYNLARATYDETVALLQSKGAGQEHEEAQAGLKIISPDGSEQDYRIN